ncbi:MAG TPA: hypothetical protein VMT16_01365 [Thermoanaerobaculia bacterium]|nr:hypothetical protein [Thermoanaerobaculia bacterium]
MRSTPALLLIGFSLLPAGARCEARELALTLDSSTPGVTLAATLRLPEGDGIRHAALLLPVAGPTDRDLSVGDRGIYRAAAEILAAEGIATLRLADRGVDGSRGDWRNTSFADRLADAVAALGQLAARPELSGACTGLVGMSEGGALALAASSAAPGVAFVVALSPPMESGAVTLRGQRERLLAASPAPDAVKEELRAASEVLLAAVAAGDEGGVRRVLAGPLGPMLLLPYGFVPRELEERIAFVLSPWYRSQVAYDPGPLVAAARGPVLAVFGELDQVIDARRSADLLRQALAQTAPSSHRVELRPQRNHLLMPAVTGSPAEYGTLPEVVDRDLWREMAGWVREVCGEQGAGTASGRR